MDSVSDFHRHLGELLRKHPRDVSTAIDGEMALYVELVLRQKETLVRSLFPHLCRALRTLKLPIRDLVFSYATQNPPQSAYPNDWLQQFPSYLGTCREREGGVRYPIYLEELADFEQICHQVMRHDHDATAGLNRTLHVRHYTNDVLAFTQSHFEVPTPLPCTLVVYLHRTLGVRRVLRATHDDIVAIARACGVRHGDSADAELRLQQAGVLP